MSKKDIKQDLNNEPQQLEDKELDQVNGGYTEVEWTYAKTKIEQKKDTLATSKDKNVVKTGGGNSI